MIKQALQTILFLTSSAIVIPYTTSFLCNMFYGWPQTKNKYKRAFNPKKVYALNYSIIQKLYVTLKYAPSYIRWKRFYNKLDTFTVRKNIPFGRNDGALDVYHPNIPRTEGGDLSMPVVIFVYGGAWGSGNKNMYGQLCVEIANRMRAVVCCPSLSTYPKGYVDDMIQDVVDCVAWVCENPHIHGANKNEIILIGHSSGGHLCMMSALELLNLETPGDPQQSRIKFDESYFNNKPRTETLDDSSGSSASFCVVNDNQEKSVEEGQTKLDLPESKPSISMETVDSSISTSTFEVIKTDNNDTESSKTDDEKSEQKTEQQMSDTKDETELKRQLQDLDEMNSNNGLARPKELAGPASLNDLSKSIKVVIGLAGVYNINNHFEHEAMRGVEDISSMAKAMYGPDYFDRFSPDVLCTTLTPGIRAPCILLIHGTEDYVVPVSSTTKLGESLQSIQVDTTVRIIPGCDHYEICLDLMSQSSKFYRPLIDLITDFTNKALNRNIKPFSSAS